MTAQDGMLPHENKLNTVGERSSTGTRSKQQSKRGSLRLHAAQRSQMMKSFYEINTPPTTNLDYHEVSTNSIRTIRFKPSQQQTSRPKETRTSVLNHLKREKPRGRQHSVDGSCLQNGVTRERIVMAPLNTSLK